MRRFLLFFLVALLLVPSALAGAQSIDILLLGTDRLGNTLPGQTNEGRADAIFLLRIPTDGGHIRVLSVERDYLVELPDGQGPNKLGIATFFGGSDLMLQVFNQLLGLQVELYAQLDLENLVKSIDTIGGLDIQVYEEELSGVNNFIRAIRPQPPKPLVAGINRVSGNQAWAFLASRDEGNQDTQANQQRNTRQMRMITAGIARLKEVGAEQSLELINQVLPLVKTNLSLMDIMGTLPHLLQADLSAIAYQYSPQTPYQIKTVGMHRAVVADDMGQELLLIHQFLDAR